MDAYFVIGAFVLTVAGAYIAFMLLHILGLID